MRFLLIAVMVAAPIAGAQEAPKVSDAYGKAAFVAARAIERDASSEMRDAKAAVDAADAEASSPDELKLTASLRHLTTDKAINNLERRIVMQLEPPARDAKLKALNDRESACFAPLADALRSRDARFPAACNSIAK